jgi:hypothetical protein
MPAPTVDRTVSARAVQKNNSRVCGDLLDDPAATSHRGRVQVYDGAGVAATITFDFEVTRCSAAPARGSQGSAGLELARSKYPRRDDIAAASARHRDLLGQ